MDKIEFLKATSSVCKILADNGISPSDYKYVPMMEDYDRMKAEGHKAGFLISYLSQQYSVDEVTVYRIIKRLHAPCKM